MHNKFLVLILIWIIPKILFGQDLSYAKEIVETLASDEFRGRGYVQKGERIAAKYIKDEFDRIGLEPVKKSYYQKFSTSVNTFPKQMKVVINGTELVPGKDFLIEAGSPGVSGNFNAITLEISDILNREVLLNKLSESSGKFLVIESYERTDYSKEELKEIDELTNFLRYHPDNPALGTLFLTQSKLTWGGSTVQYSKPSFTIKVDSSVIEIEELSFDVDSKFIENYSSQNVAGMVEGESSDSLMIFIAHYDHLGMMGDKTMFSGANDNASGIAMLLNLASYYRTNKPKYQTVFIAFGGEELGFIGAKHFVENPPFDLSRIKFLLNFDISGTGDDGIQVVNGSIYRDKFDLLTEINDEKKLLQKVKIRGEACNSDHCIFHMAGIPCFFIYTLGGIQAYHDIYDTAETLPLTEFEDYFKLVTLFVNQL
ncbi:MAG: M28 family peptidase [Cytophagales bacterium]|nr:M28 family peptidase [Cytophagales bacterium]